LIVIDFIDMEESRNQRAVERRLKEALKNDRARIQVGRISPFGLLEMSRQRLRPSLAEASMETCPSCGGAGLLRSTESAALHVLRAIEEEGLRGRSAEIRVHVPTRVALYVLNNKRQALADIEARYSFVVGFVEDNTLISAGHEVERVRTRTEAPPEPKGPEPITALTSEPPELVDEEVPPEAEVEAEPEPIETTEAAEAETAETGISRRRRRRRRGRPEGVERGHMRQAPGEAPSAERELQIAAPEVAERDEMEIAASESLEPAATHARERPAEGEPPADDDASSGGMARRRRRGRRGGRRRRGRVGGIGHVELESAQPAPIDGEPSEAGAPAEAAEAETHGESDDRARRHRRRGRRGRGGIGPGAGEDSTWRSKPRGETHTAVDDMGPKAADSSIAAEPSARYEPVAAEPRADHKVEHHAAVERSAVPPAEASKERRPVPQPLGDEEPAQPDGPPRRGWWQRVLTGR
jgi:ribonuclease E